LAKNEVGSVLTGSFEAQTMSELSQTGVKVLVGLSGSVRRAVENYRNSYCLLAS